jgi:hypothetical protein
MLTVFSELIKNQNENLKLSTVYVRPANVSDYFVDKITLLFKEQFLSRKDIFQISQSLIDTTVYPNKDVKFHSIPECDEMNVGVIASLKGTKMRIPLTGLVTSSTDFQLRSKSSSLYFLVEISKDTYDFIYSSKTKYELIIEFLKQTFQKLKQTECSHIINVIFFTRIYFTHTGINKLLKKKFQIVSNGNSPRDYIYKSNFLEKEYFFDVYSKIIKININKLDTLELVNMLNKGFEAFASIFKTKNLSDFIAEIRKNYETNLCKNHAGKNLNNYFKTNPNHSNIENYSDTSSNYNHSLNFNNFFCPKFFDDIENFRMTTSNTSNLFESINVIINDLNFEKKKMYKLGNLITVISSGEYFPYYNYKLSKLTKEGLFEHGIPCCMVILSKDTKAKEIYSAYKLYLLNENEREFHKSWSNENLMKAEEKTERGLSISVKGNPMKDEDNLKMLIAKNYGIMDNLNANKICFTNRKNSSDNFFVKDNNCLSYYKYESDTYSHVPPKWMKIFYINSSSLKSSDLKFNLTGFNSFISNTNNTSEFEKKSFSYRNRFNSSDREGGDKDQNTKKNEKKSFYSINNSEIIENDIFNAKKIELFEEEKITKMDSDDKIHLEYLNLTGKSPCGFKIKNHKKRNVRNDYSQISEGRSTTNLENFKLKPQTIKTLNFSNSDLENNKGLFLEENSSSPRDLKSNGISIPFTLNEIREISNIYKPKYKELKNKKNADENKIFTTVASESNLKTSNNENEKSNILTQETSSKSLKNPSPPFSSFNIVREEFSNTDEYKELKKRGSEYDHEVFNLNIFGKTSKIPSETENVPCSSICKRNLVLAFEFSETEDDFLKLLELLLQVPLLPIFGEFDTHAIKDDVGLNIHSVTTPLNSDINILEEIIFERINNNYQIVRNTNLTENHNKPLDLKNIDSILLFDRRFYHIISTEELNYKVRIYNYSNKLNKYFSSSNNLQSTKTLDQNRPSVMYDNDFNLEYNYFIYDFKVKMLSGKKLVSTLGEKNNIYWYKYDHLLNEIQANLGSIKFKNEIHLLLIDKLQRLSQKKSRFYFKSKI